MWLAFLIPPLGSPAKSFWKVDSSFSLDRNQAQLVSTPFHSAFILNISRKNCLVVLQKKNPNVQIAPTRTPRIHKKVCSNKTVVEIVPKYHLSHLKFSTVSKLALFIAMENMSLLKDRTEFKIYI